MVATSVLAMAMTFHSAAATLPSGFTESVVATGLSSPTAMEFAPDGRLFVCQQGGQLRVIKNGVLLAAPFLTVTVSAGGERGLLGIAFDPNFAVNQYVYIYYTATTPSIHNRVSRFTANGDTVVAGSEVVILDLNTLGGAQNHNGGAIHFGGDGKLYIAAGENATASNSQSLSTLLGKMLRVNSDGSIPTDNPFYNTASGANRAIWAMGLRNPFTFAVQPGTGRIFINDVGQDTWEEINEAVAGANYGWPNCEGFCSPANGSYRDPIFRYPHGTASTSGNCIAGGTFYNLATAQFPAAYSGVYFFADYESGWIRKLDPANGNQVTAFATGINTPVDVKVSADGRLYYLAMGSGAVYAISATGSQSPQITQQPVNRTVAAGQSATFTVTASGTSPLSYRWQRSNTNIPNATTSSYTLTSVTAADNGIAFRCVVTNAYGAITSSPAYVYVSNNNPPLGTIAFPTNGTLFSAGNTISFSGTATDTEDGNLSAAAFSWTIVFHHDIHTHPFAGPFNGVTTGSFVIPTQGETAANVWYRINLTVTDSAGQTHTSFRDVTPRTVNLSLATSPPGLQATLDGQPITTPVSITSVVGMQRTLGVVSPQTFGGTTYQFVSWSDGGAASHVINSPASATTYTATYQPVAQGMVHYDFTYANRASLLAGGWDFLARTAAGAARNTEQTIGNVVNFDQAAHPGVLRIPTDTGDLWRASNDSRNSLFRTLPANWTSIRLKLSFAPTQNYQQASIVAYQDDDNYVQVTREFNDGNKMAIIRETGGSPAMLQYVNVTATANLYLRLDRDATTERLTGYYSLDGANWTALGSGVIQPLNNPRLAIFVGASPGGFPNADILWAEVFSPAPSGPMLTVSPANFTFSVTEGSSPASQSLGIINSGGGTLNWTAVADGSVPAWLTVSPVNGTGNGAVTVLVDSTSLPPGVYSKSITVTATGATNSPQTVTVNLTVNTVPSSGGGHFDFNYANRASLLAGGWDFLARTAAGATRNTEQTTGAVANYDQAAHPGVLRIPTDVGDLWGTANNSRNSLFRNLPANWTSLRLKFSFAPTQNYQQVGLVAYQDDNTYVQVTRIYNGGDKVSFVRESGGSPAVLQSANVTATANLHLRIDRDVTTERIIGYHSLDGVSWTGLGSGVIQALNNPRLAIFTGASSGGFPNADLAWAEVLTSQTAVASATSESAGSPLTVIIAPGIVNDKFGFGFMTQSTANYLIEYKNDLSDPSWQTLTNVLGTGSVVDFVDPSELSTSRFYRVRIP